jgi:hypothetical protein
MFPSGRRYTRSRQQRSQIESRQGRSISSASTLPRADVVTMGMILDDWDLDRKMDLIRAASAVPLPARGPSRTLPLDQWLGMVESRRVPAENGEAFDMRIVSTGVTGQVATVKVADLYRGLRFTDYLSLVKVDGQWRIVNKTFHHD